MDTSVYMSGLVNLGAPHSAFFEQLGLPSPKVMTIMQLRTLLQDTDGALSLMMSDPDSDQVAEWLTRQILDIAQQFFPGSRSRPCKRERRT